MQSLFNIGFSVDADIRLDGEEERRWVEMRTEQEGYVKHPLYADGETVSGKVAIRVREGRRLEHLGIRAQFLGLIEITGDRNPSEFIAMGVDLVPPGELRGLQTFPFEFRNVEKKYESFFGTQAKLRYVVRVTILRKLNSDIVHERDLAVFITSPRPRVIEGTQLNLGIATHLSLDLRCQKNCYSLSDVVIGTIRFLVVRVKISHVELGILRRETIPSSTADTVVSDSKYVAHFEIMNGPASRGDLVPFRMFLAGYTLTPTFKNINKRFSVTYYLYIAIVDEDGRRYFKQEEITLYRDSEGPEKPATLPLADLPAVALDVPNPSDSHEENLPISEQKIGQSSHHQQNFNSAETSQHVVAGVDGFSAKNRPSLTPDAERMLSRNAYEPIDIVSKTQAQQGSSIRQTAEDSFQNHPLENMIRPAQ